MSIYTFTEIGVFDVDLTATDESSNSDTETYQVTVINTLGIDDFTKDSFVIAPNPVGDVLHFQVPQSVQIESVTIIDITGKILLIKEAVNTINLSALSQGIYFVKVATNKGTQIKRFVKE